MLKTFIEKNFLPPHLDLEERARRILFIQLNFLVLLVSMIWGASYLVLGQHITAMVVVASMLVGLFNMFILRLTKNFTVYQVMQISAIFPAVLGVQISLGGFIGSGAVMMATIISPIGAAAFISARAGRIFFLVFTVFVFAAGLLEYFHLVSSVTLDAKTITAFFVMNIMIACLLSWLMIQYYFQQREQFRAKMDEKNILLESALHELKATQLQLIQAEKMSSLGQLTAGVAHEINNPINFVSGNITPLKRNIEEIMMLLEKYASLDKNNVTAKLEEILKYKNEIDLSYTIEEIKMLVSGIEEGSKRTAEIVKGLRNFSRLDEEDQKKANINEGIESTLILLHNKATEKNIDIIKSLGEIPEIDCYPGQLNQVFMNLISNAMDAMEGNGEGGGERKIFIATSFEKDHLKISIRDTGAGMSDEVKQKIFDPFFTTKDVGKGTGLGLSISYGIIEKHHGKIEVKSEAGAGTEFIILLPV